MSMGVLLHICFAKMSADGVAQSSMRKKTRHFVEKNVPTPTMINIITPPCQFCGDTSEMEVDEDKFNSWMKGERLQRAFPNLHRVEREMLIIGTHPDCWDKHMVDYEEE